MPFVLVTGSTDDNAHWEQKFRTHGDLFENQTVKVVRYAMGEGNRVAALFEVDDLDTYFAVFESPDTGNAMAEDGFQRESAEVYVLDHEWTI